MKHLKIYEDISTITKLEDIQNIKQFLSNFLKQNGTERFAKLISDSIDNTGPNNGQSISITRENFAKKFLALSKRSLLER
jgi:flagellar hook assembly protein FlgD